MTIHVAHIVTSFDMGGLQNGIVNIVNASDSARVRHTILSMRDKLDLGERLQQGDVHTVGIPEGRVPAAYRLIAQELSRIAPDVVHTRNWGTYPDGVLAARKAGVRARVHGYHGRDLVNAHSEKLRRRLMGKFLASMTDRFIALTPSMKREYTRDFWVAERRVDVIPNGIDLERMTRFEADPALRSPFTVSTVGRLAPVKNVPFLVRAFARMSERGPDDVLAIAGDGPEREVIEKVAAEEDLGGALVLLGERKDAPAVMKASDVYVQPSFYEGMSNTIVEAMACGVAVIATDVGGNGFVAGRDGTAVLVPSDDVAALSAALDELRRDLGRRERLAEAGRRRVTELFGLDSMVEAYTAVYEDVCALRRGRGKGGAD